MAQGEVPGTPITDRQRETDQLRAHGIQVAGLRIHGHDPGPPGLCNDRLHLTHVRHEVTLRLLRRRRGLHLELLQQGVELQLGVQLVQRLSVPRPHLQSFQVEVYRYVAPDGHQLAAQPRLIGVAQQGFTGPLRLYLLGVLQDRVKIAVLLDQLACGLLSDTAHAGDVVRRVAHQREEVDYPLRRHPQPLARVLGRDPLLVDGRRAVPSGIQQGDAGTDELVEVLVPRHDHRLESCLRSASRQRA